jgi:hypothetical protein
MAEIKPPDFNLLVRYNVLQFFARECRAPAYQEIARLIGRPPEAVRQAYRQLHDRHLLFLEENTPVIRMAHPFSSVPTDYQVRSGSKAWWANCAWDALGIPAAMGIDAEITARYAGSNETVQLLVEGGKFDGRGHVAYFAVPFRYWYADLVYT